MSLFQDQSNQMKSVIFRLFAPLIFTVAIFPNLCCAQGPLTFDEVSFMRRSGASEADVRKEIERRKLRFIISPEQKQQLTQLGLSVPLVQVLDRPEYTIPRDIISELERQKVQLASYEKEIAAQASLIRHVLFDDTPETVETKKRLGIDKLEQIAKTQQATLDTLEARILRIEASAKTQQTNLDAIEARILRIEAMLDVKRK